MKCSRSEFPERQLLYVGFEAGRPIIRLSRSLGRTCPKAFTKLPSVGLKNSTEI